MTLRDQLAASAKPSGHEANLIVQAIEAFLPPLAELKNKLAEALDSGAGEISDDDWNKMHNLLVQLQDLTLGWDG